MTTVSFLIWHFIIQELLDSHTGSRLLSVNLIDKEMITGRMDF